MTSKNAISQKSKMPNNNVALVPRKKLGIFKFAYKITAENMPRQVFSCEYCKFLRTAFFIEPLRQLLLNIGELTDTSLVFWRFHIRSFSGPHFPAFGLKTVSFRIQSECGKLRTRKMPNTETLCSEYVPTHETKK